MKDWISFVVFREWTVRSRTWSSHSGNGSGGWGSETQNRCELAGTRTPTFIIEINIDQSIFQSILSMTLA